jgi:hypothetical protein
LIGPAFWEYTLPNYDNLIGAYDRASRFRKPYHQDLPSVLSLYLGELWQQGFDYPLNAI